MKFQRWNKEYHLEHPNGFDKKTADRYIVQMLYLMAEEQKKGVWGSKTFPYGHMSADSFEVEKDRIISFSQGATEMEYCPAEEESQASDFFALGLIIYEMINGKSYCDEKQVFLALDYERIRVEQEQKGKHSLLDEGDFPPEFAEIGRVVREMTLFSQEDRIQSLEELPNAEYEWQIWDADTKQMLEIKVGMLEGLGEKREIPVEYRYSGRSYACCQSDETQIEYSFLKKTYQTWYRSMKEWSLKFLRNTRKADLGFLAQNGNQNLIFVPLFRAGEEQKDWKYFTLALPESAKTYITMEFFWRKIGYGSCVVLEQNEGIFQKAGVREFTFSEELQKELASKYEKKHSSHEEKHKLYIKYALKEKGSLSGECWIGRGKDGSSFSKVWQEEESIALSSPAFVYNGRVL